MDLKQKILDTLPIHTYINRFVPLKKKGGSLFGLCPFHGEKTPSFSVQPQKGFFHCFGCKKSGNLITFAMEYHGLDFKSALEVLAAEAGIDPADYRWGGKKKGADSERAALKAACDYFTNRLYDGSPAASRARNYLEGRKVPKEVWQSFGLGYAPSGRAADGGGAGGALGDFGRFLQSQKIEISDPDLEKISLARKSKRDDGYYAFFRDRIIFPIHSVSGMPIAFGGRALDNDTQPKYINSANNSYFDKSRDMYNLNRAVKAIRDNDFVIIVEGYMDVIGLAMKGIHNAVAPLGTSLTEGHLKTLSMYTKEIHFIMDGDSAGQKSALKGVRLCQDAGLESRVILLEAGNDPFDFCQDNDDVAVLAKLDSAESGADYRLKATLLSSLNENYLGYYNSFDEWIHPGLDFEEKRKLKAALFEDIAEVKDYTDQELLIHKAAGYLGLDPKNLWADYVNYRKARKHPKTRTGSGVQAAQQAGAAVPTGAVAPIGAPAPGQPQTNAPAAVSGRGFDPASVGAPTPAGAPAPAGAAAGAGAYAGAGSGAWIKMPGRPVTAEMETSAAEVRCEAELLGFILLHPQLSRFSQDLETLSFVNDDATRLVHFLLDRWTGGESTALRDLYGTAIGNELLDRFTEAAVPIDRAAAVSGLPGARTEGAVADAAQVERVFWELFNRKSLWQLDRGLKQLMTRIRAAEEESGYDPDMETRRKLEELRGEMIRIKRDKVQLQEKIAESLHL